MCTAVYCVASVDVPPAAAPLSRAAGNGVFLLLLLNVVLFVLDHVLHIPGIQGLYLNHAKPQWYQVSNNRHSSSSSSGGAAAAPAALSVCISLCNSTTSDPLLPRLLCSPCCLAPRLVKLVLHRHIAQPDRLLLPVCSSLYCAVGDTCVLSCQLAALVNEPLQPVCVWQGMSAAAASTTGSGLWFALQGHSLPTVQWAHVLLWQAPCASEIEGSRSYLTASTGPRHAAAQVRRAVYVVLLGA